VNIARIDNWTLIGDLTDPWTADEYSIAEGLADLPAARYWYLRGVVEHLVVRASSGEERDRRAAA